MTHYFLTRIKIEGFRGINNENQPLELKFKPESVNSVFAINATGKSSIFEALCYAIRGYVPKLRELQASERPEDYVANLFHSGSTATVELEIVDDTGVKTTITVIRTPNGNRTVACSPTSADPIPILKALDEDFTLLDYEQFTKFINSTPLDRGRSFSALLGLSGYTQLRQLLQSLSDTRGLNTDFDLPSLQTTVTDNEGFAKESFSQFRAAYTGLTGQTPGDVGDVAKWGIDILAALNSIDLLKGPLFGKKLSQIEFAELRHVVRGEEGGAKRDQLGKLVEITTRLDGVEVPTDETSIAEAEALSDAVIAQGKLLNTTAGAAYQRLQDSALHLYRSGDWHDPNRCALCQTELGRPLQPKIEAEVAKYEAVRVQEQAVRRLVNGAAWIAALQKLELLPELAVKVGDRTAATVVHGAEGGTLKVEHVDRALEALRKLRSRLGTVIQARRNERNQLEKELPPSLVAVTTQIELASRARDNLSTFWKATQKVIRTRAQVAKYQRWQKYIKAVTDEICDAEASLTASRLKSLGDDYKELFRGIMGVKDVVPVLTRLDQNQQLDVRLDNFHGLAGLSARALLSESYRNALAVSVFLSAAGMQKTAARFIVLDDVTSSFDAGHQFRLMEEIRQRLQYRGGADGLQFIILSHDGLLEKYFDKVAQDGGWHHQRLQGMPPLGAITTVKQDAQRLRKTAEDFLAAGQVSTAEPLLRQYLEFSLLCVVERVKIPVPIDVSIRDDRQMVQNMLDAILAAVKLQQQAGGLVMNQTQVNDLDKRHVTSLISNWVSHYSTGSTSSLSPSVLLGVLDTVDELTDCFKWDDTTTIPASRRWYRSLTKK